MNGDDSNECNMSTVVGHNGDNNNKLLQHQSANTANGEY